MLSTKKIKTIGADAEQNSQEYREYLDSWVHEIKTPITSALSISQSSAKTSSPDTARQRKEKIWSAEGLTLNLLKAEISHNGQNKKLTKNEMGILRLLMENDLRL